MWRYKTQNVIIENYFYFSNYTYQSKDISIQIQFLILHNGRYLGMNFCHFWSWMFLGLAYYIWFGNLHHLYAMLFPFSSLQGVYSCTKYKENVGLLYFEETWT